MKAKAVLADLRKTLDFCENPFLESELILAHNLGLSREQIVFNPELQVSAVERLCAFEMAKNRANGLSLSHVIGHKEFWGRDFAIHNDVLSPRPETELLVEITLKLFLTRERFVFADFGVGSGCLIATILLERAKAFGCGCDIYRPAIINTNQNIARYGLSSRARILMRDFCVFPNVHLDLIVSNPPYIPGRLFGQLPAEVKSESRKALFGGSDGLRCYRSILKKARRLLKPEGLLLLEIGLGQLNPIKTIAAQNGFQVTKTANDLQGITRAIILKRNRHGQHNVKGADLSCCDGDPISAS